MAEVDEATGSGAAKPTAGGLYDAYLGGTHHTDGERAAAEALRLSVPEIESIALANRAFHQRAVKWLAMQGIRQFLDLGSGLPTQDNTHEVVRRIAPDARVLYVDHEMRTADLGLELVADDEYADFLHADVREPDTVLGSRQLRDLLDLDQPVAVVATGLVHFFDTANDPWDIIARYVDATAPGSYLTLDHGTSDKQPMQKVQKVYDLYRNSAEMVHLRHKADVEWFFRDLELVPPYEGADPVVTFVGLWGCEDPIAADDDSSRWVYCGVARKP